MLKFFRRIRKKLIEEGKLKRYLIYAVGEILLVMIGILLALQVNTWNQAEKDRVTERKYLESLSSDLSKQSIILKEIIDFEDRQFIAPANNATELINNQKYLENLDSLKVFLDKCANTRTFSVINTTYEDLKSTGNFQIITSAEIKNEIIVIYKLLSEHDKRIAKNNGVIENLISPFILGNKVGFYHDNSGVLKSDKLKDPEVIYTILRLLKRREGYSRNSIKIMAEIENKIDLMIIKISDFVK